FRSCCPDGSSTVWGASTTVAISKPFSDSATHFSPRCSANPWALYCKILPAGLKRSPTTSTCMAVLPRASLPTLTLMPVTVLVSPLGPSHCDTQGFQEQPQ